VHAHGYALPTGHLVHRLVDCDQREPWEWLEFAPEYDWGSIGRDREETLIVTGRDPSGVTGKLPPESPGPA